MKKQKSTQRKLECTLSAIKSRMDTMRLRLNTNKMECIAFGSKAQLQKIFKTPLTTGNHVIQMTPDVKYLGGMLDSELNCNKGINHEDTESSVKLHMYKGNMEIPHQTSMHNTSTIPMFNAPGLW